MGLRIDSRLCQGHARCAALAPELFDLDENGFGIVRPGCENAPANHRDSMRPLMIARKLTSHSAAISCPASARSMTKGSSIVTPSAYRPVSCKSMGASSSVECAIRI